VPHAAAHRSASDPGQLLSVRTVADPRPGRVAVEVVGEVDTYTAPVLDICLQSQASQPGVRELVVHLGQVQFLGAAGIEVLAQVADRCRTRRARLAIHPGGRRTVLRCLQLAGLDTFVAVDRSTATRRIRVRTGSVGWGHDVVADPRQ
jgi:anti-sigma B factor antagonist